LLARPSCGRTRLPTLRRSAGAVCLSLLSLVPDGALGAEAGSAPPPEAVAPAGTGPDRGRPAPEAVPLGDPLDQIEAQISAGEGAYAERWLEARIEELESGAHRYAPELVRPLTLLGDAQAAQGRLDEALDSYQRALHLNRVNAGLVSPEQVEIVYREAEVLKRAGNYEAANDREEYAYFVLTQAYDNYDTRLLPGVYHLAGWYGRTGNIFSARALYEHALRILEANGRDDSLEAIPALTGLAQTYRLERFPPFYLADGSDAIYSSTLSGGREPVAVGVNNFPAGEEALQRIVAIHRAQESPDPVAVAEAMLDLADWYLMFDKQSRAVPLYGHVWERLAAIEGYDVASRFAEPELLYFPRPSDPRPPPLEERGEEASGYVDLRYEITDSGYVRRLDTLASEPEGLMDFRVRKSMRLARYRPMLVDGVPVSRDAVEYRYEFSYYPRRSEEAATPEDGEAVGSGAATSRGDQPS